MLHLGWAALMSLPRHPCNYDLIMTSPMTLLASWPSTWPLVTSYAPGPLLGFTPGPAHPTCLPGSVHDPVCYVPFLSLCHMLTCTYIPLPCVLPAHIVPDYFSLYGLNRYLDL
jgi:hypothetical protein